MSGNHTPTPWRIRKRSWPMKIEGNIHQIVSGDDFPTSFVPAWDAPEDGQEDGTAEALANAEFIVTAVNSYASSQAEIERLTALLKSARSYVSDVASNNSAFLQEEAGHDLARIDAALSGSKE